MTLRRAFRRHGRREPLSPAQRHYLLAGLVCDGRVALEEHLLRRGELLRGPWALHSVELLADFIRANPGRRPWAWWRFDAPEPARRRVGGIGTPCFEVLAYAEQYDFGIPCEWVRASDVDYYNGRARDSHGNRIGTQYRSGHFKGLAIDPLDPPRFESQAAFLKRHELLSSEECARLTVTDYEPECLEGG